MRASPWFVPALALLAAVGLSLAPAGTVAPVAAQQGPCTGTVAQPANGTTVVSVQGAKFAGEDSGKRAARLVAFGPNGSVEFVQPYGGNIVWGYDVDPMANGNLFVTATIRGDTRVFELDPETGERVWQETFDALDTHDADLVRGNSIALANMRNYDEDAGENRDRLFVYNRTTDEVTEEWLFDDHYPRSAGGNYEDDWTHVNDVDRIGEDRYLLSPRNLDQVIVVNTETGEIEQRLGADGNFDVLRKQHNPDYLRGAGGTPTMLVGDSDNDRVVEYARVDGEWQRTWKVGEGQFDWPRDADRLPNGNTLITDSRNHRVLEVTPGGEVVWEVYVPWLPYDAERIGTGDGSNGPTVREQDATGAVRLAGSAGGHEDLETLEACGDHLASFPRSTADEWPPEGVPVQGGGPPPGDDAGPDVPFAAPGSLAAGVALGLLVVIALGARYRLRD